MFHHLAGPAPILLLLDFDGTLSEIAPRPEDAVLRPGNGPLLEELARHPQCTVGVISGRTLADVAQKIGVPGLVYAGNHGLEIDGPGLRYLHPDVAATSPVIAQTARKLAKSLSHLPGALVENKSLTLTVHYRRTPEEHHDAVAAAFHAAAQPLVAAGRCRVTAAKSALELRPAVAWDKGRALRLIRSRLAPDAFPIYIGDDATDEDAFQAAQAVGGAGVFVSPADADTCAHWRLDAPADVTIALADLLRRLPNRNEGAIRPDA